ncbi:MAG: hypothetical protein JXA09_06800 [Anaerolineae bacterium]|nr:hypothetical protein [Anaerolineae bacterium]
MFLFPPAIVLAIAIASIYAVLFNLWRNGGPRDLLFHLIAAWVGFGFGQIAGLLLPLDWGMIGSLHVLEGTFVSLVLLFLVNWLRLPRQQAA